MKVFFVLLSLFSVNAMAVSLAPNECSYNMTDKTSLDTYDNTAGELVLNGQSYTCDQVVIVGQALTACKPAGAVGTVYPYLVSFDGAENDLYVWVDLTSSQAYCQGKAQ